MAEFGCARCDARWGGVRTAHCGSCHETFSGLSAFEIHRAGSHSKGRYCLDPSTVTNENPDSADYGEKLFKRSARDYPCWSLAGDMPEFWSKA
ncbi:hypothetical protein OPTIMUS_138 [Mycobacterium phage Optimus]|uniref:C2H2-type domain-containing protein n=3 Tax=Omegavirus TaxID=1623292 RepID=A0A3S9UAZ8_9CAUD|nr:hypothetical protein FDG54_gp138 [Mycobacterium phage Optimus]YP_009636318.1 hypothetical protein FGG20_gp147 [Mycobacterium phage Baka]AXQ52371.1 hypothetical protein SEA_ERICMILLARD_139 [Mycobacterium phage EricMillard]AZS07480.1 hypothetical protein PBI_DUKE13_143 [Mycobacterium phage Duke13]AEJ92194.1 hypothetical protein OPTIMUS_138 [Mycobacterium phage Optimus]AEK08203.1 hypothetical protein PBI_BAKA_147 [Mycobacterium phage Baka]